MTTREVRAAVLKDVQRCPGGVCFYYVCWLDKIAKRCTEPQIKMALQHHRRAGRIRYDRERRGWVPVDGGGK